MKAKRTYAHKRQSDRAKLPPKSQSKFFTVDPPEGMTLLVGKGFCTDTVPKGHTLEFVGSHAGAARINSSKQIPFAELKHVESGRMFRLPLSEAKVLAENGTLRE